MATVSSTPAPAFAARPAQEAVARTTRPVKFFALVGCTMWAFQIFVLIKWVTGPFFHQVDPGPTPLATSMKVAIVTYLVLQWCAFFFLAHRWVVRPWRRERHIGFDGLLFIAWAGFFWFWDPMGNWNGITFTYNAWIPNMGSWVNGIPGWMTPATPDAQAPEPWLFTAGAYSVFFVAMPIAGCWLMRKIRERRPQMGTLGLLASVLGLLFVLETVLEGFFWMRMGLYAYPATPDILVLNPSHYYKYPLLESLLWGAALTAVTWVRWTRNDRGESIAERGTADLKATNGAKTGLRLMAVVGCCYSLILVCFWIPYWLLWSPHVEKFPMDIQQRSYLMDGLCGPGTHIACPDKNVPAFREHSVTITPDGKLYVPPGVTLPHGPTTFEDAAARRRKEQR